MKRFQMGFSFVADLRAGQKPEYQKSAGSKRSFVECHARFNYFVMAAN